MRHLTSEPDIKSRIAKTSFTLFALGGVTGLLNLITGKVPFGWGYEMYALAVNLVKHGTYANPLSVLPTGVSALAPPLYPLFLALILKLFHPQLAPLAATIVSIVANALTAALMPRVSQVFFNDATPGMIAAVFWLLAAQLVPAWDMNCTLALILVFCLFSASSVEKSRVALYGVWTGLLAGALLLLNPMALFVFLPWLAHLLVSRRGSMRSTAIYCCIVLGTAFIAVLPWMLRNERQLGSFAIRTGLGFNLFMSNNDCAQTTMVEDLLNSCAVGYQPNLSPREASALRNLGEVAYDHERLAETENWIRSHPDRFTRLSLNRFFAFWFPRNEDRLFKAVTIWIFTALSVPGLILMACRRERVTAFVLVVLAIYPFVYYFVLSSVRYRYPVLWLSMLPAGYFVYRMSQMGRAWLRIRPAVTRGAAGTHYFRV
jgi:hypothetical protein